jgi:hypothetical protein
MAEPPPNSRIVGSVADVVAMVLPDVGSYLKRIADDGGEYQFMELTTSTGTWGDCLNKDAIYKVASRVAKLDLWWENKRRSIASVYHRNWNGMSTIAQAVVREIETDLEFRERLATDNHNRLFFKNGYYDFNERRFIDNEGPGVHTAVRVQHDFPTRPSGEVMREFYRRLLEPILPDEAQRRAFLSLHVRGLAGSPANGEWAILSGELDCGKSVMAGLHGSCFGDYVVTFHGDSLLKGRQGSGSDVAAWPSR